MALWESSLQCMHALKIMLQYESHLGPSCVLHYKYCEFRHTLVTHCFSPSSIGDVIAKLWVMFIRFSNKHDYLKNKLMKFM